MTAIVGGLVAALVWGASAVAMSRTSKQLGGPAVAGWVLAIGLVALLPIVALTDPGDAIDGTHVAWALAGGTASAVGISLLIVALRDGKVGVVAPIASAQGAAATPRPRSRSARRSAPSRRCSSRSSPRPSSRSAAARRRARADAPSTPRAVLLASVAMLLFGFGLVAAGTAAEQISPLWIAGWSRVAGVLLVSLPLAARRRLPMTRTALPLVAFSGVCEVAGYCAYTWGARADVAIAAVLASQFAAVAAVGGWLAFKERLTRTQIAAVAVILVAVAALTIVTA